MRKSRFTEAQIVEVIRNTMPAFRLRNWRGGAIFTRIPSGACADLLENTIKTDRDDLGAVLHEIKQLVKSARAASFDGRLTSVCAGFAFPGKFCRRNQQRHQAT